MTITMNHAVRCPRGLSFLQLNPANFPGLPTSDPLRLPTPLFLSFSFLLSPLLRPAEISVSTWTLKRNKNGGLNLPNLIIVVWLRFFLFSTLSFLHIQHIQTSIYTLIYQFNDDLLKWGDRLRFQSPVPPLHTGTPIRTTLSINFKVRSLKPWNLTPDSFI